MIDFTRMFSESPATPARSPQMPRTTMSILHPGLARGVERVDHLGLGDRVELDPDLRRPPGPGVLDLGREPLEDARLDHVRRDRELLERLGPHVAGDVVEDPASRRARAPCRR